MTKWNTQKPVTPVTEKSEKQEKQEPPIELAWGAVQLPDKLWAVKMIMYRGDKVLDVRVGNGTTPGHAWQDAQDMLSHFYLYERINFDAPQYFRDARMI